MTCAQAASPPGGAGTILVVEDDRSLREGLAVNFQLRGYRVLTAAHGEAGARLACDERPDLIVLDLMLPGLDGFEVLGRLREREIETPALILSARGQVADKVEGFRLGADYQWEADDMALWLRDGAALPTPAEAEAETREKCRVKFTVLPAPAIPPIGPATGRNP